MPALLSLLNALGWSLLDSVWQMAIMWIIYQVITSGNLRISATGKYNLALLLVVFCLEWFGYSFFHLLKEPPKPVIAGFLPLSPMAILWVPYLGGIYLIALLVRVLQFGLHYRSRNADKLPISVSAILQSFTDRYVRILGITKPVRVYLSEMAITAETSGFLKPLILLPASLVTQLSSSQLEAILIHELYHIRRNDYLVNLCISCFRSVFFFNPFAHLFYKALERERELACDDGVLELGYEPTLYAEALFSLERHRQISPGFSLAVDGNKPWLLMDRIRRMLGEPIRKEKRISPMLLTGLLAALVFLGLRFTATPGEPSRRAAAKDPGVPIHFEVAEEKTTVYSAQSNDRAVPGRYLPTSLKHQLVKRKGNPLKQEFAVRVTGPAEEAVAPELAYYVDNNIIRNYSNESGAGPVTEPIPIAGSTPYVPSSSFSYELHAENPEADSAQQVWMEKSLQDIVIASRVHLKVTVNKLQKDLERNTQELKEIEKQNEKQISLEKQKVLPLIKKAQLQIRLKKEELKKLQIRLQVSSQEIIHI